MKWISIKKRFPKKNKYLLISIKGEKEPYWGFYDGDLFYATSKEFPFYLQLIPLEKEVTNWKSLEGLQSDPTN